MHHWKSSFDILPNTSKYNSNDIFSTVLIGPKNNKFFVVDNSSNSMWHQQADYNTYRAFFNNLSSELQSDVDLELRIPEIMELGTDDEKALTKALEHSFPNSTRYLCTKHLKDNIKITWQTKRQSPPRKGKPSRNLFWTPMIFAMLMTRSRLNKSLLKLLQRQATHSL